MRNKRYQISCCSCWEYRQRLKACLVSDFLLLGLGPWLGSRGDVRFPSGLKLILVSEQIPFIFPAVKKTTHRNVTLILRGCSLYSQVYWQTVTCIVHLLLFWQLAAKLSPLLCSVHHDSSATRPLSLAQPLAPQTHTHTHYLIPSRS